MVAVLVRQGANKQVGKWAGEQAYDVADKGADEKADEEVDKEGGEMLRLGVRLLTTEGNSCSLGGTRGQTNGLVSRQVSRLVTELTRMVVLRG